MDIGIKIDENRTKDFTPEAKNALFKASEKIVIELIDEACRIERGRRIGETAEITDSDVKQAEVVRPIKRPRKKKSDLILQGLCPVLAAIPGFVFDKENLLSIIITILCLVAASIITVILIMKEDNNG